jgi:hypothetical protein
MNYLSLHRLSFVIVLICMSACACNISGLSVDVTRVFEYLQNGLFCRENAPDEQLSKTSVQISGRSGVQQSFATPPNPRLRTSGRLYKTSSLERAPVDCKLRSL